uniref:Tetraspanin n=1 Tax=Heterosigma akashiwo TaxID=2829 RepID=A0A6S9GRY8_HETAK|mmetsp:Transcript_18029/g.34101  ORF Transcript_18029/g.34101 Transcript_18029/m.34101 type:complete len:268 (-) Transcript_18029:23-826(-)
MNSSEQGKNAVAAQEDDELHHRYLCIFCGCRCKLSETSKEFNRGALYVNAVIYMVMASVLIGIAGKAYQKTYWRELFDFLDEAILAILVVAVLMVVLAFGLVASTWQRKALGIVCCLLGMAALLSVEIGFGSFVVEQMTDSTFDSYVDTEYLQSWEELVASAETETGAWGFLVRHQARGGCCGWTDYDEEAQNMAYLNCTVSETTDVCAEYFHEELSHKFEGLAIVAVTFTVIQLTMMVLSCALIVRVKKFYRPIKVDRGDWIDDFY